MHSALVVAWSTGVIDRHAGYDPMELVTQDKYYPRVAKILEVNNQVRIAFVTSSVNVMINKTRYLPHFGMVSKDDPRREVDHRCYDR